MIRPRITDGSLCSQTIWHNHQQGLLHRPHQRSQSLGQRASLPNTEVDANTEDCSTSRSADKVLFRSCKQQRWSPRPASGELQAPATKRQMREQRSALRNYARRIFTTDPDKAFAVLLAQCMTIPLACQPQTYSICTMKHVFTHIGQMKIPC